MFSRARFPACKTRYKISRRYRFSRVYTGKRLHSFFKLYIICLLRGLRPWSSVKISKVIDSWRNLTIKILIKISLLSLLPELSSTIPKENYTASFALSTCFRFAITVPWRDIKLCPRAICVEDECCRLACQEGRLKSLRAPCLKLWCIIKNNHGEMALLAWQHQ